jgi:hypothetical protein
MHAKGRIPVIAGTGANSTREAIFALSPRPSTFRRLSTTCLDELSQTYKMTLCCVLPKCRTLSD